MTPHLQCPLLLCCIVIWGAKKGDFNMSPRIHLMEILQT